MPNPPTGNPLSDWDRRAAERLLAHVEEVLKRTGETDHPLLDFLRAKIEQAKRDASAGDT